MNPPAGTPLWAVILIAVVPSLATVIVAVIQSRQIRLCQSRDSSRNNGTSLSRTLSPTTLWHAVWA
nr:MAG TPA: hypothetical protein [Caudoviricetes sp.]